MSKNQGSCALEEVAEEKKEASCTLLLSTQDLTFERQASGSYSINRVKVRGALSVSF